jgi:NitT/TauT family transport system substrate-binding protein
MKEEELKTFMLADYGLDFPEDGIYTTVDFRKNHPDVCKKMMRAIRKGWQYSFENIHETIEAVVQTANENNFVTNANHQQWMIKAMKELVPVTETKDQPWGYLAPSTYSGVCNILQHQHLIKNSPPSYGEFYQPVVTPENVPAPATTPAAEGGDAK